MEYNYKALVEEYVAGLTVKWDWYKEKAEQNYSTGEDSEGSIIVHIQELVNGHAGCYIQSEFCAWFNLKYAEGEETSEECRWDFDKLTEELTTWINANKPKDMDGYFFIGFMDADSSLNLYYSVEKQTARFSKWRREEGYKSWDALYNDELCNGKEYDEITEEWDDIKQEFEDYCENNNYEADVDED